MRKHAKKYSFILLAMFGTMLVTTHLMAQDTVPSISMQLNESDDPNDVVPAIKIIVVLTLLALAPALLLMMTAFTRILIVLSFVRQALGTMTMPPNQVIIGLSLFLTLFIMSPVIEAVNKTAVTPYLDKKINQEEALDAISIPLKTFMLAETRESDIGMFFEIAKLGKPKSKDDIPMNVLIPAFMISELKTAFQIGFLIYIPFLIIDMVISSVLMAMGMLMLPPTVISLPFKLVLFVLVDGWSLIVGSVVRSFNSFV